MADAIGQSLAFAVGIAISPAAIIGIVLILGTSRGRANGPAFALAWLAGVVVVGTIVLLAGGGLDASEGGQPADWVSVLKLVLAAVLVGVAARQWRRRPRDGQEPEMPNWMRRLDGLTVRKAVRLGALLSAVNPKNLLLIIAGAAAISQTGASSGEQAFALAAFALIASVGVGIPLTIYLALGERSRRALSELEDWMSRHDAAIMAVICVLIAAKLVGDAISALA